MPQELRDAAHALGVSRWRTIVGIVLPERARRHPHRRRARDRPRVRRDRAADPAVARSSATARASTCSEPRSRTSRSTSSASPSRASRTTRARLGRGAGADRRSSWSGTSRARAMLARDSVERPMTARHAEPTDRTTTRSADARPWTSDTASRRGAPRRRDARPPPRPYAPLAVATTRAERDDPRARSCSSCATSTSTTARRSRVAGVNMKIYKNVITAMIGPSGCGKSTVVRSLNRMNDSIAGFRVTGEALYHGHDLYGAASTRSRCAAASAWSSSARTRSRSRSSTTSPGRRGSSGMKAEPRRARREGAARRGAVGRGQGPPQAERARPLGRPAAAPVHRARDRDRARRAAARRAVLGARPDLDGVDRGADARRSRATTRS